MSKQRAKLRKYANAKGYQNFDPGYAGLSRKQERDNREISDLKENLRDIKARDSKQETAIDRANRITAESRDAAYSFVEDKTYAIKQDSLAKNRATEEQNFRAEQAQIQQEHKNLMSLVNFSETLVNSAITVKNKNWDATAEAAYNYYMNNGGLPIDRLQATDAREDDQFQVGELINQEADNLAANGGSPKAVNWIRHKNSAAEYGRMKALAVQAGNQFGDYAASEIMKSGLTDPNQIKAKLNEIQINYLKANGLYDPEKQMAISADFLGPTLGAMAKSRNAIVSKYEGLKLQTDSQKFTQNFKVAFFTHKNTESLNNYFKYKSVEYDKNGKMFGRNPRAVLNELLGDVSQISPEEFERIVTGPTSDGIPWDKRFPGIIDELREKRDDDLTEDYRREKNKRTVENSRLVDSAVEFAATEWDGDKEELEQIIQQLKLSGADTSRLNPFLDESIEERRNDFWENHFDELTEKGILRAADVARQDVPYDVRKKYIQIAQEQDKHRKKKGQSDEDIRETFNRNLRARIEASSTTSTPHYSLGMAEDAAFELYNKKLLEFSRNENPKAHEDAMTFVNTQIEKEEGKFHVLQLDKKATGNQAAFSHFTPGDHPFAPQISNPLDFDKTLEELQQDANLINTKPIIAQETLELQADNIRRGLPIKIPSLFYELSAANPDRYGTPLDMLKGQFKAAKINVDVGDDARAYLVSQIDDPKFKAFMKKLTTKQELVKGVQYVLGGPRNENFMSRPVTLQLAGMNTTLDAQPGTAEYSLNQMMEVSGDVLNSETVTLTGNVITAKTAEALEFLTNNATDYRLDRLYGHQHNGFGGFYFEHEGEGI